MEGNLKLKFDFVRSDIKSEDVTSMAILSDVETIACACINHGYKLAGCNLLTSFGRVLESPIGKRGDECIKGFLIHLDEAELRLS